MPMYTGTHTQVYICIDIFIYIHQLLAKKN